MKINFFKKIILFVSILSVLLGSIGGSVVSTAASLGVAKVSVSDFAPRPQGVSGQFTEPLGQILKQTEVDIQKDDTMAAVIGRALDKSGMTMSMPSGYISSIGGFKDSKGHKVDSFGEGSAGEMSGWMVTINDWLADSGVNDVRVEDGDIIDMMYSCNGGEDIGASWNNTDEKVGTVYFSTGKLDSLFSPDKQQYHLYLPDGASSLAVRAIAANRNNKVEIFAGDKLYKPMQTIPVVDGMQIKMVCTRKIYDDSYQLTGVEKAEYSFDVKCSNSIIYSKLGSYYSALTKPKTLNDMANAFDWSYIASKALGLNAMKFYPDSISDYAKAKWSGEYGFTPSTNLSRMILSITSAGLDPSKLSGKNMIDSLAKYKNIGVQGVNAQSFALLAVSCYPFKLPAAAVNTKESLVDGILKSQLVSDDKNNGGFALMGQAADPDVTAIAIQALSTQPKTNTIVWAAIEKALDCLSAIQQSDGNFIGQYGKCSESISQAVIALTSAGVNPLSDARFIKNQNTLIDVLLKYYLTKNTGEFSHLADDKVNKMSTDQAALALGSLKLFLSGERTLYDFSNTRLYSEKNVAAYIHISKMKISSFSGSAKALTKITVYKKASVKKGKRATVKKGAKVAVKSVNGAYARIKIKGKYGYVKITSLKFSGKQKGILLAGTNAYKTTSVNKGVWKKVKKNDKYDITARSGNYYKIILPIKV